jgi:hypothetical protein
MLIKSLAVSTKSSFTSLLTEIEFAVSARLASPFDLKNLFSRSKNDNINSRLDFAS